MVLYNLYLVLINERIRVYDNKKDSIVYEGSSENIPDKLMIELVHDVSIVQGDHLNKPYLLIHLN